MSSCCGIQLRNSSRRRRAGLGVDALQRAPSRTPRAAASAASATQPARRASASSVVGADPADLAVDARARLGRSSLRPPRPPAWAARTTAAPTSRTAARSRAPGSRTCAAGRSRGRGRTAPARSRHAGRGRRRGRSARDSDCSHCSKSALANAITASSSSGSCATSLTSTANGLPKSPARDVELAAERAATAPAPIAAGDGDERCRRARRVTEVLDRGRRCGRRRRRAGRGAAGACRIGAGWVGAL